MYQINTHEMKWRKVNNRDKKEMRIEEKNGRREGAGEKEKQKYISFLCKIAIAMCLVHK